MEREEAIKQLSEALAVLVPELNETNREERDKRDESEPIMIDLGLPSGRLWADRNVGAKSPEDDGLYFSWGNVVGHTADDDYNFDDEEYEKTSGSIKTGYEPGNILYDAAASRNNNLRTPRMTDFAELVEYCDHEWVERNGVKGMQFTSRINGNSIFFPASGFRYDTGLDDRGSDGFYWSASLYSQTDGYYLTFSSGGVHPAYYSNRYYGFSVRAVQ